MGQRKNIGDAWPSRPRPPHDPVWWLLDARAGWKSSNGSNNLAENPKCRCLTLTMPKDSGRLLTEASGSFGGLTVPSNVAIGPGNNIYLLDNMSLLLKRFDPCECLFEPVPCFGGKAAESGETGMCGERPPVRDADRHDPRRLSNPQGIAVCSGNLFVCDTGNHRLCVFSLRGFVLRAIWTPPHGIGLSNIWDPFGVAFDGKGRVFVSDPANGSIHRFSPSGMWEEQLEGFGKVTHIAVDCRERIYAIIEKQGKEVRVVDNAGKELPPVRRPEEIGGFFPRLPFRIDRQGNLDLSGLCLKKSDSVHPGDSSQTGVFNLHGDPLKEEVQPYLPSFEKQGLYISEPLDSKLYRCQWHRVSFNGKVPSGARIIMSTYTAETDLPAEYITGLPAEAWDTNQQVGRMESGEWDCLVRSGPGRYLWLRAEFKGNGSVTPAIESMRIEFPRISLRRYLPAVFGENPHDADFTDRFLGIFDTTLRSIERKIDNQALYFDPLSTPAKPDPKTGVDFLSWLASWIGLTLDRQWSEQKRRQFLKRAARLYHLRGTREGLWRQLVFLLDMECPERCCPDDQRRTSCRTKPSYCGSVMKLPCAWQPPPLILENYQLRRWLFLGAGRLGDQAVLWGKRIVNRSQLDANAQAGQSQLITAQDPYRDPFHVYAHKFTVFVPASYGRDEGRKRALQNLLEAEEPAHTLSQLVYVEPRFRIGFQSMIGFDSVVGRYPEGVRFGGATLGYASVLGKPSYKARGPFLEIGREARIGTTTKLD